MLAHGSVVAKENPFIKVLKYSGRDHEIISLRQRCLEPGLYSKHLQHWSKYYPLSQVLYVHYELGWYVQDVRI